MDTVWEAQLDPTGCLRPSLSLDDLSATQGRNESGYLMNKMPTWRQRSSQRLPGEELMWRQKTRRFDFYFLEISPSILEGVLLACGILTLIAEVGECMGVSER